MPAPPAGGQLTSQPPPPKPLSPWRLAFRVVRWSTYVAAAITLVLMLHTTPPPAVQTSPQAAARVEQKMEQVQQAVTSGEPATLRMDQTELNSYLASHLDIASNVNATQYASPAPAPAAPASTSASDTTNLTGTPDEQIEQVRSSVKDVKVELVQDHVRAHVIFDFHGKDMSLDLEGKLAASNGYLHFEPVSGHIGSLPIPQSTLESAMQRMMDSPENREKLKLPDDMSDLKIENGEVVATYN